jgi:hypothetical protein
VVRTAAERGLPCLAVDAPSLNENNSQLRDFATNACDVITFCALLLTLAGAVLVYLASAQQRLRASSLPTSARFGGWLLFAAGTALWWHEAGLGAGITAALTSLMLTWVLLPYVAWWRISTAEVGES